MRTRFLGFAGGLLVAAGVAAGCSSNNNGPYPPLPISPTTAPTTSPPTTPAGTTTTAYTAGTAVTTAQSLNGSTAISLGFVPSASGSVTVSPSTTGPTPTSVKRALAATALDTWQITFSTSITTPSFSVAVFPSPANASSLVMEFIDATSGAAPIVLAYNPQVSGSSSAAYSAPGSVSIVGGDKYYLELVQGSSVTPPTPTSAPSAAAVVAPLTTQSQLQALALQGIAIPTFTSNGLTLKWGQAGGSGGGSGGSGGGSNLANPSFWINNNPNNTFTVLGGGSVSITQFGGLSLTGCVPGYVTSGSVSNVPVPTSNVLYSAELTFTTSGNVLYANNEIFDTLVNVVSGTLPTGTYYGLIGQEGNCAPGSAIETPLVNATGGTVGQLKPNTPFQINGGSTSITTQTSTTYAIEVFYQ